MSDRPARPLEAKIRKKIIEMSQRIGERVFEIGDIFPNVVTLPKP